MPLCYSDLTLYVRSLSIANGLVSGDGFGEHKLCCIQTLTNLAEIEAVFDDVKYKFVPLVKKWINEDPDIFNLLASIRTTSGNEPVVFSIQDLAAEFKPWLYLKM